MPKLEYKQHKLRVISVARKKFPTYGITIPPKMAEEFKDALFFITKTKHGFILTSGAEIKNEK